MTPRVTFLQKPLLSLFRGRRARANRAIFEKARAVIILKSMLWRTVINLRRANLCNSVTHARPILTFSQSAPYGALLDGKIYMQIDERTEERNPFCGANRTRRTRNPIGHRQPRSLRQPPVCLRHAVE